MFEFVLLTLLLHGVLGNEECVTYTFGEDFYDLFVHEHGIACSNSHVKWDHNKYTNSAIVAPNEKSDWYISSPLSGFSCAESFTFPMRPGGIVELNVHLDAIGSGFLTVYVVRLSDSTTVGINEFLFNNDTHTTGWRNMKINILGLDEGVPFQGNVIMVGVSSIASIIVDSLRYVPASLNPETACLLYQDETAVDPDDKIRIIKKTLSFSVSEFTVSKNK